MKLLALLLLSLALMRAQSVPEPLFTAPMNLIHGDVVFDLPPSPSWVPLYEVPSDWGCTIQLSGQCFASLKRISGSAVTAPTVIFSVKPIGRVVSEDAAAWVFYATRLLYPGIGLE